MPWHKICHTWVIGVGPAARPHRFCTKEPTFPGWYNRLHKNDPDPAPREVKAIDPGLLMDGDGLAAISAIANNLSADLSGPINAAVEAGAARLQKRLPNSVRLELKSTE